MLRFLRQMPYFAATLLWYYETLRSLLRKYFAGRIFVSKKWKYLLVFLLQSQLWFEAAGLVSKTSGFVVICVLALYSLEMKR